MSGWDEHTIAEAISSIAEQADAIDPDGPGPIPFRKLFDRIGEVREAFRQVRFEDRSRRQDLWEALGELGDRLAAARVVYRANCEADQARVSAALDELDLAFHSAMGGHAGWRDFWAKTRETRELLKAARFARRDSRDGAWSALNALVDQAQTQREQKEREREDFALGSDQHRKSVLWHVERARPVVGMIADLLTLDWINTRHDELKFWSAELREARQQLSERSEEMTGQDRREVRESISEVQEELNAAWEQWKEYKQEERERRADEWRERMTHRREKLEEIIGKKEAFIGRQEANLEKLNDMLGNARSDERIAQIETWIEEATDRKETAEEELRELEDQLAEVNERLG